MILNNLKAQIPNFPIYKIVATDIDEKAISLAKLGIYNEESTKEISNYYENKYFKKFEDYFGYKYSINNEIKNNVEFINEDATSGHKKRLKYDIVFCRYLLIYFNRDNRDKFLRNLENQLTQGSLLFLGKTETIFNRAKRLAGIDDIKLYEWSKHSYNSQAINRGINPKLCGEMTGVTSWTAQRRYQHFSLDGFRLTLRSKCKILNINYDSITAVEKKSI